jgi:hypothetical protein
MAMLQSLWEYLEERPSRQLSRQSGTIVRWFQAPAWPDYEGNEELTSLLPVYKYSSRLSTKKNLALGLPYVSEHKCSGDFTPQRIDESWIRPDQIAGWLRHCGEYHRGHCFDNRMGQRQRAVESSCKWLIDVEDCCLVAAIPDMRYFALSYIWGEEPGTTTTIANLGELQEQGAIMRSDILIPALIRDVMRLTSLLENRYLWVRIHCYTTRYL